MRGVSRVRHWVKEKGRVVACIVGAAVVACSAAATPPALPAIEFPFDEASIVAVILAAVVAIWFLTVGPSVAISLGKMLVSKLKGLGRG